jgi:hypothetical protein
MCATDWGQNKSTEDFVGNCLANHQVKIKELVCKGTGCEDECWMDGYDTE